MNNQVCKLFNSLWFHFPDKLDNKGNYNFLFDNNNIDVVDYIVIWLNYMLRLKENGINKLDDFYTNHIETNTHYIKKIDDVSGYIVIWKS
ncbi:hypothetical protein YYC_04119 [Plasmodium yoelii 17X]|uniref:Uncharacterized protein n=1 Tax=Plasmodium yoelii 17X TaxID=1323249 RepID=V7PEN8_PLAYE|nr:hypothetical protein YYC_04119 [Plasmodium yoelii 17X]